MPYTYTDFQIQQQMHFLQCLTLIRLSFIDICQQQGSITLLQQNPPVLNQLTQDVLCYAYIDTHIDKLQFRGRYQLDQTPNYLSASCCKNFCFTILLKISSLIGTQALSYHFYRQQTASREHAIRPCTWQPCKL